MTVKKRMGFILKNVREMRGFSQQYVANELRKTQNAVYNWELGRTSPPADDVISICRLLDITPNQLFGWDPCKELSDYLNAKDAIDDLDKQIAELQEKRAIILKKRNDIAHSIKP